MDIVRRRVDETEFRQLMSYFPSGVAVITTLDHVGGPCGFTCTSFCSVSTAPPTVLVCPNRRSASLAAIRERGAFAVNMLNGRAAMVARTFAATIPDRFEEVPWRPTSGLRLPWLTEHAHSVLECTVDRYIEATDHMVVFGRVRHLEHSDQAPLLYGRRRFEVWPESDSGQDDNGCDR